jgi:hypothetical protein
MTTDDVLVIDDIVIPPGSYKTVEIQVARLLSGTLIHMPVHVFRSENPGPTFLLAEAFTGMKSMALKWFAA